MIFTRAGSARAFRRSATSSASWSLMGPAATGAQQTGEDTSMVGSVLGTKPVWPVTLT